MRRVAVLLVVASVLPACGKKSGSSGGAPPPPPPMPVTESEPNDTSATADALLLDQLGQGSLAAPGDADVWAVALTGGSLISVEIFGTRVDQGAWDAGINVPRLTVLDTDGTTVMANHDGALWGWLDHDWDIPCLRIPADGTYFVQVTQDVPASPGGPYGVRVRLAPLTVTQVEAEVGAGGTNDTVGTAEPLAGSSGVVRGFHVDDESDYYSFPVAGPTMVRLEVMSYRNGIFAGDDDYFDNLIEVIDSDGVTVLGTNDDREFYDAGMDILLTGAGPHYVHVTECCDAGDAEYFLIFSVVDVVPAAEAEPNDGPGTANATAFDTLVTGIMGPGEMDVFSFVGTAGDMIRVHLFTMGRHEDALDTVLVSLIDTDAVSVVPSDFGGPGGPVLRTILQTSGTHYVEIIPDPSPVVTPYAFVIERFKSAAYEVEANNVIATANALDGNGRAAGVIGMAGDADVFSFTATAGVPVLVVIYADNSPGNSNASLAYFGHGSDLDPALTVLDGAGGILAVANTTLPNVRSESVLDGLPTAQVAFVPASSGTHYVRVEDTFGAGGATFTYVVERR